MGWGKVVAGKWRQLYLNNNLKKDHVKPNTHLQEGGKEKRKLHHTFGNEEQLMYESELYTQEIFHNFLFLFRSSDYLINIILKIPGCLSFLRDHLVQF